MIYEPGEKLDIGKDYLASTSIIAAIFLGLAAIPKDGQLDATLLAFLCGLCASFGQRIETHFRFKRLRKHTIRYRTLLFLLGPVRFSLQSARFIDPPLQLDLVWKRPRNWSTAA